MARRKTPTTGPSPMNALVARRLVAKGALRGGARKEVVMDALGLSRATIARIQKELREEADEQRRAAAVAAWRSVLED